LKNKQTALALGVTAAIVSLAVIFPEHAHASAAGGGGLPWEQPLTTLTNSIKGPVAFALSVLGLVSCGAALIFAPDHFGEFAKKGIMLVLVISLIALATNVLSTLFNVGALI
jgi:type IV secretion system protein VirB2